MIFFVHFVTNKKYIQSHFKFTFRAAQLLIICSYSISKTEIPQWNLHTDVSFAIQMERGKNSHRNDVKQRWITNRWFHYFHWKLKAKEKLNHNSILSSHFAYLRKTRVPHLNSFNVFAFYRFLYSDLFRFNWETLNVCVGFDSIQDFVILLYHFPRV